MKLRIGACALVLALAGCSGESPESGVAGMRGVAASKATGSLPASLALSRAIGASIANAPDRGALLSYPNKATATKQEGAYTWYPTSISEAHAFKGIADGEMTVPAPDGSQVKLRYERHVEEIDGNWTWIGRVVGGDQMQEAIITFGEKAVFGSIPQANGKPALSLQTRNGSVFAVLTDPSKVVSATKGHVDVMVPEAAALRSSMGAAVSQAAQVSQGATAIAQGAPQTAANTIDIAIGYTPEFATANGGASGAATRLVYLVQVGNQAFVNSNINGYLRIVNAVQVSYTNTNTNQAALSELTGSNGQSAVTIPASLAPLRTARDQYGADIAVLVRKFNTPENAGCGIAWLNGANQTAITAADASWGYAVISDGYDQGTDGATYYCADETLVHEAAHLMGSAHDRANSKINDNLPPGGTNQLFGRYPYSFGYKTAAASGNFYTVMAYGDEGQIAHRIFSTPLKSTCGAAANLVCGVADSEDNARSLNQTLPIVATFRATVVAFGKVPNDFDGDGRSDVYWRNASTGNNDLWTMNGLAIASSSFVYSEPSAAWKVIGTGFFNSDAKADVLWRNTSTGQVYIQHMDGKTVLATSGYSRTVADQNWKVVALGDFNNDGVTDLYWRNTVDGSHDLWLMGALNPVQMQRVYNEPNLAWNVIGTGDFNGDSLADIIWRNTSTGENYIQFMSGANILAGTGFTRREANQAWKIVAIRDFDGDGKSDIYWRNDTTGVCHVWLMDGLTVRSDTRVYTEANLAWKVVNSGDYNGDGLGDLFWRNSTTGENYVQLMNGTSITGGALVYRVADTSWQVTGGDRLN
ncbi:FG-GAP-like repeat-containing protein [Pseudoxanthomonas sp. Root630]|uniref:FG-GAP-like repeat-containing protein n=1 Tax=Pseudoxanthomonas sp. Root630 TaxID=1736574 RepID=UPI0009D7249D|nr:FG-GAP-like repeat-containing protein [Pseudoxanthomonas sp. Root630]